MQIVLPGITGSGELWLDIMKIICGTEHDHPFSSMCDLMCHKAPYTPRLGFAYRTYVDIQDRELEYEWQRPYFKNMDVFDFLRNSCNIKYDVMICSDGIEHLYFDKGTELLSLMEEHSNKQIIFTPLGPYMLSEDDNPDSHRSGWFPEMLPGYLSIVLPDFHPTLEVGAFFAVNCSYQEKQRIIYQINNKYVENRIN